MALPQTEQSTELREKVRWALGFLNDKSDYEKQGVFAKLGITNPFDQWPPDEESLIKLFDYFQTATPAPEYVETITPMFGSQQSIDTKKLDDLIAVFDKEVEAAKQGKIRAIDAAQKFVKALKEQAKQTGAPIAEAPETPVQEPKATEAASVAPVSPERIQQIISATVQHSAPPDKQTLFFHALTSLAAEKPEAPIETLTPRVTAVVQAAEVLVAPASIFPQQPQGAAEPRVFEQLRAIVNNPLRLPKNVFEEMTSRWGKNFVESEWFTRFRADANRMLGEPKAAANILGKISAIGNDIGRTVFVGPIDENIFVYTETYRLVGMGGIQLTNVQGSDNILLGYGGQFVRMGGNYVMRAGAKAVIKKAAISGATKVGIEVATGAATGGWGWVAMAATSVLGWLKDKGAALLRGIFFMGTSPNPEDNWVFIILGIAGFFMFILPLFGQSMIDTSIITGGGEGGAFGGENGYITAVGPIGTTTRSCANTEGILLNQCNSPWGGTPYKGVSGCTICRGGCGPTSTTMVLHAFGSSSSVSNVAGRVAAHDIDQYKDYSCSSYIQSNLAVMQEEGLRTIGVGLNWREASKYLSECGLIFALGNTPTSGHFVVITGINWDTSGKNVVSYSTLDPYYSYTTQNSSTFSVTAMYAVVHK